MSIKRVIIRTPVLGRCYLAAGRLWTGLRYVGRPALNLFKWLIVSRETTNFTYDLDDLNKKHLAAFVAQITGKSYEEIMGYVDEIETDQFLRNHIRVATLRSDRRQTSDCVARYGRRIGWYAIVRAMKPRVVVETGVDKGLGACVLTAALLRNEAEGFSGRYFGTDIDRSAGELLVQSHSTCSGMEDAKPSNTASATEGGRYERAEIAPTGVYANLGEILYGDSIETLRSFDGKIDLLINDSNHDPEYEAQEYEVVRDKMSEGGIILGDNSHVTDTLLTFAHETGRRFLFFQERPADHWYPGAGIGAAY